MWRVALVCLLCAGCAVKQPNTFRLKNNLLIPPASAETAVQRKLMVPERLACSPSPLPIKARGKRTEFTVRPEELAKLPPAAIRTWTVALEEKGCLPSGNNLAEQIAYAVPLKPNTAFQLLYANDRQSGWLDILPGMRLQVVSPILRDEKVDPFEISKVTGTDSAINVELKSNSNVLGFETSWYTVDGGRIVAGQAERVISGKSEAHPSPDFFRLQPEARVYRIYYKANQTGFTQLIAAARHTSDFPAQLSSCEQMPAGWCMSIPLRVAVNPLIRVQVNGKETLVHLGSSVGEAIRRGGGQIDAALPHLTVRKPYKGSSVPIEFTPPDRTILQLALSGGESISWQP